MSETVLELRNVRKYYPLASKFLLPRKRFVRAVDGVSLVIPRGRTLGLVGESGSGKSTLGRIAARLTEPSAGTIHYCNNDVTALKGKALRNFRTNIQVVFQDPYNSLNPRLTVQEIIAEPLMINRKGSRAEVKLAVQRLMDAVGLSVNMANRLPKDFSGGQRQRIAICRALALNPGMVVCDEPVSALDVSIQAKIINLLGDLQKEFGLAYLFISHDLNVVRMIADEIAVMYLGLLCETGPADLVLSAPLHPYSRALLSSVPDPHVRKGFSVLPGDIPGNIDPPKGCRFHTRCPEKMAMCAELEPVFAEVTDGRSVACLRHERCLPARHATMRSGSRAKE